MAAAPVVRSFAPILSSSSRALILGSMPGVASLRAAEYYAHPRNGFWPIVQELIGVDAAAHYHTRVEALRTHGYALWDVAGICARPGSLDADIDDDSVVPNDVAGLLRAHPSIARVCLNGGKAAALFRKHIAPRLGDLAVDVRTLPSTSPAHAARSLAEKRALWHAALAHLELPAGSRVTMQSGDAPRVVPGAERRAAREGIKGVAGVVRS